tara:strand:- start:333 stop:521 length:189 start_codon:yes stop_codon:yes gene_type:complete
MCTKITGGLMGSMGPLGGLAGLALGEEKTKRLNEGGLLGLVAPDASKKVNKLFGIGKTMGLG